MNTFLSFGYPPEGKSAHLPQGEGSIPEPFRQAIVTEYEAGYPGVYIQAGFDPTQRLVAFYHRTAEIWARIDDISEVVLTPTGPAKGPGWIEIGWQQDQSWPRGCVYSSGYSEAMRDWMRERANQLAQLIGRPCRETQVYADC